MPNNDKQLRKNTLLALNMAVAAAKAIEKSKDRVVLQQEYDTILKNLNVGRIINDPRLQDLFTQLLKTISDSCLEEEQCRQFETAYSTQQKKKIFEGIGAAFRSAVDFDEFDGATLAVSPWLTLGKAMTRGVSAYFGYRQSKDQIHSELGETIRVLGQEKLKTIRDLQLALFQTTWHVLSTYGDADTRRLTGDDLLKLEEIIQSPASEDMLKSLEFRENIYRSYPPYWFYRAKAALACGKERAALDCLGQFDAASGDVLRNDPYKVQAAKYRIMLEPKITREFVKEQLAVIREHGVERAAPEWTDVLFYGIVSYAVGEKERGKDAVRIVMKEFGESELSPRVLHAMENGRFDSAELLPGLKNDRLKYLSQTVRQQPQREPLTIERVQKTPLPEPASTEPADRTTLKEAESSFLDGCYAAARQILTELAQAGSPRAMYLLSECCELGLGGTKDEVQAASWLEKAKDLDEPLACFKLGERLPARFSLQKNMIYEKVRKEIERSLRDDDPFACCALARMCQNGWGGKKDVRQAALLYKRAADCGLAEAMRLLGQCYLDSEGLPRDEGKAAALFAEAAEKGNAQAMYSLSVCYINGTGVKASHAQAADWCAKAEALGCTGPMTKIILAGEAWR